MTWAVWFVAATMILAYFDGFDPCHSARAMGED